MNDSALIIKDSAFLMSQTACALIEALGMISENLQRASIGMSMAYIEEDFAKLLERHPIGWNSALTILQQSMRG